MAYIANESNELMASLLVGAFKTALMLTAVVAYAAVQSASLLDGVALAVAILIIGWTISAARTVMIFVRRRPVKVGEQATLAVLLVLAGTWAAYDLFASAADGLPWWRELLEGAVLLGGVSAALRLLIAATSAFYKWKWLRPHLDDDVLASLLILRHHAVQHRDDWGSARSAKTVAAILEASAHAIEHHLANRLGTGRDRATRRQRRETAREIAASWRERTDDLFRRGGAERLARFSGDAIALVLHGQWLDHPRGAAPPRKPLWRRIAKWLLILTPLPAAVVAESAGLPLPGVTVVAAFWLLANLMAEVDKDHFNAAMQMTTSMTGAIKQFGSGSSEARQVEMPPDAPA